MSVKLFQPRRWIPNPMPSPRRQLSSLGAESTVDTWKTRTMRYGWPLGGVLLLGATGVAAASFLNDVLIYQGCSSKAMEKAANDPRIKKLLGENIEKGSWHKASIGLSPEGRLVSCSFPIHGSQGHANLHLRAVKHGDSRLANGIFGLNIWEVLVLEALVPSSNPSESAHKVDRINLMEMSDMPKSGDLMCRTGGPCNPTAIREV